MSDLAAFHEVRFPVAVSFGATGGPGRRNEVVTLASGHERRNARSADSRRRYDAGTGLRSIEDVHAIIAFFEARRGSLHGFRFRDPFDMKSCLPTQSPAATDQQIGAGDGDNRGFHLAKTYGEGEDAYRRAIVKPVAGTVLVAVDGTAAQEGEDWEVDGATGAVTFLPGRAPPEGAVVTAGFEFDVPARFDADELSVSLAGFRAGQIPSIPIVEIRP